MKQHFSLITLFLYLSAPYAWGHGDHSVPGTMPPEPHGGFVKEAEDDEEGGGGHTHSEAHEHAKGEEHDHAKGEDHSHAEGADHDHAKGEEHAHGKADEKGHAHEHGAEESQLFFEAVYKDNVITLYPLTLRPQNLVTFTAISLVKDISDISVRVEFPRAKRFEPLTIEVKETGITAKFDSKKANRFIVHVTCKQGGEKKLAKVQVEEN